MNVYRLLLILPALLLIQGMASADSLGRVTGRVDCQNHPGCPGIAVLWKKDSAAIPDPRRFTLPPGIVSPLQADGVFALAAPPGDYYVGAFLRKSPGPMMGPPRIGDLIFLTPNPAGEPQKVRVVAEQTADAGIHGDAWIFAGLTDPAQTGIAGQILDTTDQPVSGLLVFAFADAELSAEPVAVSTRSDEEGHFHLPLAKPGTLYLRARKNYRGGQPNPGEYVGVFGGAVPRPLLIAAEQLIAGLRIKVRKIPEIMQLKNAPATSRPQLGSQ